MIKLYNGEVHAVISVDRMNEMVAINEADWEVFKTTSWFKQEMDFLKEFIDKAKIYEGECHYEISLSADVYVIQYCDIATLWDYIEDDGLSLSTKYLISRTAICELFDEKYNNPDTDWMDGTEVHLSKEEEE